MSAVGSYHERVRRGDGMPRRGAVGAMRGVKARVDRDHVFIVAAGVAFAFFVSVFPTLFAAVSIYGLLADPQAVERQVAALSGLLPPAALELLRQQLQSITQTSPAALQWGTAIAILLALWSASSGSAALIEGLNVAYDVPERRGFLKARLVALALSLGFVLFLILSVALIAALPNVIAFLPLGPAGLVLTQVGQWALLVGLILVGLGLVYRHAPSPPGGSRQFVTPGAVVGAVLWLAASALFSWYAASFGRFNETHGTLGAVVALLLWLQISCIVVLLGAEIDAAAQDRAASAPRPDAAVPARPGERAPAANASPRLPNDRDAAERDRLERDRAASERAELHRTQRERVAAHRAEERRIAERRAGYDKTGTRGPQTEAERIETHGVGPERFIDRRVADRRRGGDPSNGKGPADDRRWRL